jgi:hypothetical protein
MKTILLSLIIVLSLTNIISCKKNVTVTDPPLFDFKLSDLVGKWGGGSFFIKEKITGSSYSGALDFDIQSENKILRITNIDTGNWNLEGVNFVGSFSTRYGLPGDYVMKAPFRKDSLIGNIFLKADPYTSVGAFAVGKQK